jgi:hypothetical protein
VDLRSYYQQIRELEATIADAHVVVISHATPDGGKAGVRTEVARSTAAKLVVERRARLATKEEAAQYRREMQEAKALAEQTMAADRMQVTVITEQELRALRDRARQKG